VKTMAGEIEVVTEEPTEVVNMDPAPEAPPSGDPDEVRLREAEAAAEAEDKAEQEPTETEAETIQEPEPAEPSSEEDPKPAETAGEGRAPEEPVTIPKQRFDEVAQQRDRNAEVAAYWKGVAEARAQDQQSQQERQPTPQEQVAAIRQAEVELASKLDADEITAAQFVQGQQELRDREAEIRDQVLRTQLQANHPKADPPRDDDLFMEREVQRLHNEHQYLEHLSEPDVNYLAHVARQQAEAAGRPYVGGRKSDDLRIREDIAVLSDTWGPQMIGRTLPSSEDPKPAGGDTASPAAQDRLKKLELAAKHPPDTATMGTGAEDAPGRLTEDKVPGLSMLDLENVPIAELDRFLAS
jgi:hypothetical protein